MDVKNNQNSQIMHILLCDDSLEGILSAVYYVWQCKLNHEYTMIELGNKYEYRLFAEYESVYGDREKAIKVLNTIKNQFGTEAYNWICMCAESESPQKANAIYKMIHLALSLSNPRKICDCLNNEYVRTVFELYRNVNNEVLHLKGFLRFKELNNGVLFSEVGPKNDIISNMAVHFEDRLPNENWIIYDSTRNKAAMHKAYDVWVMVDDADIDIEIIKDISDNEERFCTMWKMFHKTIAIQSRTNRELQRNMLPLRFRDYMTEFE